MFIIITPGMSNIFINYRRDDSETATGRLYDGLCDLYGEEHVFMDLNIEGGDDWEQKLGEKIGQCRVFLVVIGPTWATITNEETGERRLDEDDDWVQREIATALKLRKMAKTLGFKMRIIPVRVEGAPLPKPEELPIEIKGLLKSQDHELSNKKWGYDRALLNNIIGRIIEPVEPGEDLLTYCPYFEGEQEIHQRDIHTREKVVAGIVLAALVFPFGIAATLGDSTGLMENAGLIVMILGPVVFIVLAIGREYSGYKHSKALVRECIEIMKNVDCEERHLEQIRVDSRDSIKKRIDRYMDGDL